MPLFIKLPTLILMGLFLGCAHLKKEDSLRTLSISAASGLTKVHDSFYIIADDELFLLELTSSGEERRHTLFPGTLPEDPKDRKKVKPDLESLYVDQDFIITVPSFSKKNRNKGAKLNIQTGVVSILDFSALQKDLEASFKDVNIEGSILNGDEVWLMQRGNGSHHENAIVITDRKLAKIKKIITVNLGTLSGHQLGFTDLSIHNGTISFLAVAENTTSTYDDGAFMGAVLGTINQVGQVLTLSPLDIKYKPEGLWIDETGTYVVTDADDRNVKALLLKIF